MAVTLDARAWKRWTKFPPDDARLVRTARALKQAVVAKDPYETKGLRVVLNFGHTLGHASESWRSSWTTWIRV
jgi:3-dehydroquinate synthase